MLSEARVLPRGRPKVAHFPRFNAQAEELSFAPDDEAAAGDALLDRRILYYWEGVGWCARALATSLLPLPSHALPPPVPSCPSTTLFTFTFHHTTTAFRPSLPARPTHLVYLAWSQRGSSCPNPNPPIPTGHG